MLPSFAVVKATEKRSGVPEKAAVSAKGAILPP